MEEEIVKIPIGDRVVILKIHDMDLDDLEDAIKITYDNILGEILTFPVILNRIGMLRADMEHIVNMAKRDLEVRAANLNEHYKKSLTIIDGEKRKYPTVNEIESAVTRDPIYNKEREAYYRKQKHLGYIESIYWAARSKDQKLNNIQGITPSDFEKNLLESRVNNVMIKMQKALIK
jgi:hypothetical protein